MARIQVKRYKKKYKVSQDHVKKEYPTVSYFIYLPSKIAEKFLDREFTVKLEGDRIVLEPNPHSA